MPDRQFGFLVAVEASTSLGFTDGFELGGGKSSGSRFAPGSPLIAMRLTAARLGVPLADTVGIRFGILGLRLAGIVSTLLWISPLPS